MKRVALICPGRGTYGRSELGCLTRDDRPEPRGIRDDLVSRADHWRRSIGRTPVSELDRAERFGTVHLAGENAAALIYTASVADAACLSQEHEVVAVCGNSMGWYTALQVSGALSFEDGLNLCDVMGGLQLEGLVGGQVIVPLVDEEWRHDPIAADAVEGVIEALRAEGATVATSIRLGGYQVIAGDDDALRQLLLRLPKSRVGKRDYPFQLLGHSAFHTVLMQETARKGRELLIDLPWSPPAVSLVDGRGHVFPPKTAHPAEIFAYTLDHQVVETFDFTASLRVVLREFAPETLVLLGPGETLGGSIGQVLVDEGWSGIRSRSDFVERQQSEAPILISMGRPEQYALVAIAG